MSPASTSQLTRRRALGLLGLGGVAALAACSSDASSGGTDVTDGATSTPSTSGPSDATAAPDTSGSSAGTTAPSTGTAADFATATPGETGGPFPSDGSNDNGHGQTADVLHDPRALRSDIRADLDGSNVQDGVPLALTMTVLDKDTGAPLAGAAVYVWHCNKDGEYSQYDSAMLGGDFSDRSWLRGVQVANANGVVRFTTILPGRYQGRAFHIHFEVFADGASADLLLTSQMAIDDDLIDSLYSQIGDSYSTSLRNDTDNGADGVFADGVSQQLLAVSGDVSAGLAAAFTAVV